MDAFLFHQMAGVWGSYCKPCRAAYHREYYARTYVRSRPSVVIVNGKKRCTVCGKWLPVDKFYKCSVSTFGLSSLCKDCHYEYIKAIRARQKEKRKAMENK